MLNMCSVFSRNNKMKCYLPNTFFNKSVVLDKGSFLIFNSSFATIKNNPSIGEIKKGDLAGFRVHKFKFHHQQYLLAYEIQGNDIVIYMIGTHENFYRDLKHYIRG